MREIDKLYTIQGTVLTEVDLNTCTPKDIYLYSSRSAQNLSLKYHVTVDGIKDESIPSKSISKSFVDLSSLMTMTTLMEGLDINVVTWEQVGEKITDQMILGYGSVVPNFKDATRSAVSVQVLGTPDFELFYTMCKTPEDRNVKFRRWQLIDLGVTKLNPKHPVNLKNSLLSINGLISRPTLFNDELLMPSGAQFMHSCSSTKQASVTLLDLSGLGDIQCIPFSACSVKYKGYDFAIGTDLQMILPPEISLKGKSVLMVVAYSLFFPESFRIVSDHTIKVSPHLLPIGSCLLKQKVASYLYNDGTDAVSTDPTLIQYISQEMFSTEHHGAFFVIIDTPTLFIKRSHAYSHAYSHAKSQLQVSQSEVEGFLWDTTTCSIFDQVIVPYQSFTDFYSNPTLDLNYLTTFDYFERHHAIEDIHPFFESYLSNSRDSDMYLVQIMRP